MRAFSFAVLAASSFLLPLAAAQWGPAEPWRDAVLYRDEWGTPHVYARNLSSMAYAFGYAQAADHPEALLRAYRVANGRAAEVWGEDWADSDAFALMLGHAALARQTFPNTDSATQDLCAGFAAGANAWYEEHPQAVPEWAEPVRPEDPLALMHCYLMSFAPFDLPDAYFRRRPAVSGNAWAVAPSKTESGETMLVMNPHGYYDSPFVWYEAHIGSNLTRDDWSVSGATLVGLPVLMMGHNGDLGWALTPNAADSADVYLPPPEASDQGNPNAVGGPQHSLDTALLRELQIVNSQRTYRVRTNRGFEERRVVYYDNGGHPTITTADGEYYTWNIGGYHDFGTIQQLHWMARSSNLAEFQNALELHQLSAFHVTYADISGNLLYFYSAKVGDKGDLDGLRIRNQSEPPSWNKPLPIEMRFLWRGVVPVTQLPSIENPISGYLQACGNPPWTATEDVDFQWDSFPAWFGSEADTYRARRVRQLLSGGGISYRDMQDMLFDVLVPFGMTAVPRILEAAATDGNWRGDTRSESHELIDVLRNWNYAADIRSEGMTAFQVWWTAFLSLAPYGMPEEATLEALVANTPEIQSRSLEAIDQAARLMLREFGTVRVPWGDAHVIRRGNETHPIGGSATGFPIFVVSDWEFGAKAWEADYGYGYAAAVRFGEFTESVSVLPFGVSSNSKSPHYADQLDLFRSGRLKPAWFYKDEVLPNVASARGRAFEMVARGMDATFEVNAMHPVEARIDTALRPPASVPGSLSAYSIFAEFSYNPPDAKITLEATLRASKEVRGGRPLDAFSVFAFNGQRWQPVRAQEIVAEEDAIHVSLEEPAVFALFGPARPGAARPTPKPKPAPQEPAANETVAAAPIPDWPGRGARSGAISWGRTVDLRPPAMDGVFQLKSDIEIGARLTTAPNPPRPLPEGLVAFTPYVLAELSNPDVAVTIEVDLRPTPGEVKPEDLSQLSIYACDETSAWERVSNQQFEPDVPRFAGTDTRPRIYVVLGPTGAKTSRPAEE